MLKSFEFKREVLAIHQLRVNLKSLVAESRIIRHEERRCGPAYVVSLRDHRRRVLREELRYTNLALAYVRGRSYRSVEQKAAVAPDSIKLARKLARKGIDVSEIKIREWIGA